MGCAIGWAPSSVQMGGFYNSPDMLNTLARHVTGLSSLLFALLALALALPVLAVLGSWLQWGGDSASILREMVSTVLPDYVLTTLGSVSYTHLTLPTKRIV